MASHLIALSCGLPLSQLLTHTHTTHTDTHKHTYIHTTHISLHKPYTHHSHIYTHTPTDIHRKRILSVSTLDLIRELSEMKSEERKEV